MNHRWKSVLAPLALALSLSACATGDTNRPTAPPELVLITLQPARISPNENGALLLSTFTGCYVEYVGKGPVEPGFTFRIAPTQRVPSIEQCLASLRSQPGVLAVERGK